jgi:hypothetical protein
MESSLSREDIERSSDSYGLKNAYDTELVAAKAGRRIDGIGLTK